ncbi:hypothetical protein XELAEV_18034436mg [Xenopus laevis]|uniref:Uncharacterized protein n=1 Tax=Xenopus laevis TaxID=8355 RepID=A0A974CG14_XENLA|nr:hypothetical protein XELAEV_18034436mg [Xenopus laevis]
MGTQLLLPSGVKYNGVTWAWRQHFHQGPTIVQVVTSLTECFTCREEGSENLVSFICIRSGLLFRCLRIKKKQKAPKNGNK